jgi:hypothetical protein
MARAPLLTVPDEGAAWVVSDALTAGGVTVEVEHAAAEHPYTVNALARPMRLWVPAEQLERARSLLAALEQEIASDEKDVSAQATAAEEVASTVPNKGRSGYWSLYFLTLVVITLLGAVSYLNSDEIESWFFSAWAIIWAALALILTHAFGRRRVGATVVLNLLIAVPAAAIAALLLHWR